MKNLDSEISKLKADWEQLLLRENKQLPSKNGIFHRYAFPIITADHIPLEWRFDFDPGTNPTLQERLGFNSAFNAGAIKFNDRYVLAVRVESTNRKSFFALAESPNGINNFRFRSEPIEFPYLRGEVNVYDMRLTAHEDGWIYGLFCTERRDPSAGPGDQSAAVAQCGIVRTKDLQKWERLPDLITPSPQQRNVVLHPEFYQGCFAFYTRPQDSFIEAGFGGGIGFGTCQDIMHAVIENEIVIDKKQYHTIYESKNGLGPAPIKTDKGWLHLAHGVRNTAAGLRYVLYMFLADLADITKIIRKPGGYFLAPEGEERVGDVSNVVFSNGWILDDDGTVFIYYASSDMKMHVATSSVEKLLDYVLNAPADEFTSESTVNSIRKLINSNQKFLSSHPTINKLSDIKA